ncbi:MAG: 2-amino-4-hydroxy-6-hydroxymethyldihydropteridine diphosphokinase [Gammaproteobacteria bacterium]|nr:2-amino-4-hydroxy-6-hydroxymethyldihydropteridine diphosphokinase [Gammaproteobacteria bacterium]MCW8986470.1 2-amino-4-hydroxy-6-hydroxymethyldihydropteridine diphosphokinase [Gammaproteobacteria bacterium]MCW9030695.1 2-amino-4-hydroxy-6-hydroxymethyldihydropteridine diphosphokinase [Gammaproteobacteria bacterium]
MARVYISIGSNIDAENNVRLAIHALQDYYGKLILSSVYESEAVGFEGDNFLNLVAGLNTEEDVHSVAATLRKIEDENGRDRSGPRFSPRTVDLDLLLYDDLILQENDLVIPRDEITKNAFVLLPLEEIAPQLIHPVSGNTMCDHWMNFDQESQKLWPIEFKL